MYPVLNVLPIVTEENRHQFYDSTLVGKNFSYKEQENGAIEIFEQVGQKYLTLPLKFEKDINLLKITSHDDLLRSGIINETDSLKPHVVLETVFVQVDNEVIELILSQDNYFLPLCNGMDHQGGLESKFRVVARFEKLKGDFVSGGKVELIQLHLSGYGSYSSGDFRIDGSAAAAKLVPRPGLWNKLKSLLFYPAADLVDYKDVKLLGYTLTIQRINYNRRLR